MKSKRLGIWIELNQPALVGWGNENVMVFGRFRQGMHPLIGLMFGKIMQPSRQQASQLFTSLGRDFVDRVLAAGRVYLVNSILQVVADVYLAIAVQKQIVHLGHGITNRHFSNGS